MNCIDIVKQIEEEGPWPGLASEDFIPSALWQDRREILRLKSALLGTDKDLLAYSKELIPYVELRIRLTMLPSFGWSFGQQVNHAILSNAFHLDIYDILRSEREDLLKRCRHATKSINKRAIDDKFGCGYSNKRTRSN